MLDEKQVLSFLKESELFSNFSEQELKEFLPYIHEGIYEKGHFIFHEGDRENHLYLIKKGKVAIITEDREHGHPYTLAELGPNECFGEANVLIGDIRLASAKAVERLEVLIFDFGNFHKLMESKPIFSRFALNLSKQAGKHLKFANERTVKSMQQELNLTKTHDQMGRFIVHLFLLLTFYVYILKIFEQFGTESLLIRSISIALITCFAVSGVLIVKNSGFPLEFYGLTLKNWKKNAWDSILFTIPALLFMVGLKWMLIKTIPAFKDLSLFQIGDPTHPFLRFFGDSAHQTRFYTMLGLYIAFVPLQEFIARGCLQSCLRNFFTSPNRIVLSILSSNLLFGLFHGLKSFSFIGAAFLLGIFWGWIYQRQNSIIGPSISHAIVGAWAFGILNYQSVLIY
jgi:CRP-like cAMP-binding protein